MTVTGRVKVVDPVSALLDVHHDYMILHFHSYSVISSPAHFRSISAAVLILTLISAVRAHQD